MTVVAVISDTHSRALPQACVERLRGADLIVHAGDLATPAVLAGLQELGPPVHAVHGNVDSEELRKALPERRIVCVEDVRIGMIHDAGRAVGRLGRLRAAFEDCQAVVFGHSHIPLHEVAENFQIFNPGSPTDRRRQPAHTMGLAHVSGPEITFELVVL